MMQPDDDETTSAHPSSRLIRNRKALDEESVEWMTLLSDGPARTSHRIAPSTATGRLTGDDRPLLVDLSLYDPFSPKNRPVVVHNSLLDKEEDTDTEDTIETYVPQTMTGTVPGAAGFLEMEEEPPRTPLLNAKSSIPSPYYELPVMTTSGLLLTHRRTPMEPRRPLSSSSRNSNNNNNTYYSTTDPSRDDKKRQGPANVLFGSPTLKRALYREHLEVENPWSAHHVGTSTSNSFLSQVQCLLSYARLWVLLSVVVLLIGSSLVVHHMRHEGSSTVEENANFSSEQEIVIGNSGGDSIIRLVPLEQDRSRPEGAGNTGGPIILVPLPNAAAVLRQQSAQQPLPFYQPPGGRRLLLEDLQNEFESWVIQHDKVYHSHEERHKRFQIWTDNHHRTVEKNERHGPCKLTKQPVFGSNHFKDLTREEFKSMYLTGYTGPTKDQEPLLTISSGVLGPHIVPNRHPQVHRRIQEAHRRRNGQQSVSPVRGGVFNTQCYWYDVSCLLTYFFETYFYGLGKTMEPGYDADSYPTGTIARCG
jgi:hypothetical protein